MDSGVSRVESGLVTSETVIEAGGSMPWVCVTECLPIATVNSVGGSCLCTGLYGMTSQNASASYAPGCSCDKGLGCC